MVGNPPGMGALEIAYQGPTLALEADSVRIAVAGGAVAIEACPRRCSGPSSGTRLPPFQSARLLRGQALKIGALTGSASPISPSRAASTSHPSWAVSRPTRGGLAVSRAGPLREGDRLPLRRQAEAEREEGGCCPRSTCAPRHASAWCSGRRTTTSASGEADAAGATFTVSARASDRMGMRLEGPALEHAPRLQHRLRRHRARLHTGAGQRPAHRAAGDRQTTGGYPKVATVISADLPALGRMTPGAKVAFAAVDIDAAEAAARRLAAEIQALPGRMGRAAQPWSST